MGEKVAVQVGCVCVTVVSQPKICLSAEVTGREAYHSEF